MSKQKFFRNVWRFNALLILVAGLLAVVILAIGAVKLGEGIFSTHNARAVVHPDEGPVKELLSLAESRRIGGTEHMLIALQSDRETGYFSKSGRAIRNYVFVGLDGKAAWVYPHNRFLFSDVIQLPQSGYGKKTERAKAVLFVVRQRDSDGDGQLTHKDAGTIVLVRPNGEGFREVIPNVIKLVSKETMGEILFLVYETSQGPFTATILLTDFSVIKQESLPLPGSGNS